MLVGSFVVSSIPVTWRKFVSCRDMLRAALLLCSCAVARGSNEVGEKFLAENKNKEGVITLASGMQYKVLRQGDGESPTLHALTHRPLHALTQRHRDWHAAAGCSASAT